MLRHQKELLFNLVIKKKKKKPSSLLNRQGSTVDWNAVILFKNNVYACLARGRKAYQVQINCTLERKPQKHALYLGQ